MGSSERRQLKQWKTGAAQLAPSFRSIGSREKRAWLAPCAGRTICSLAWQTTRGTFGITPGSHGRRSSLRVSDWDGYRDTVVQPDETEEATGLRIPTRLQQGLTPNPCLPQRNLG